MTIPYTVIISPIGSGTDDSAAIENAMATAVAGAAADGSQQCRVKFTPGVYTISRALQQRTLATGVKCNAQIPLPWNGGNYQAPAGAQHVVLILEGSGPARHSTYGQTPKQITGAVLKSTLTGASWDGTYAQPSMIGGPSVVPNNGTFDNITVIARGLTFRVPNNPSIAGLDCKFVADMDVQNCEFDVDVNINDELNGANAFKGLTVTPPTHPTGIGIITPSVDNGDGQVLSHCIFFGWYAALHTCEHLTIDHVTVCFAHVGLAPQVTSAPHGSSFNYLSLESCIYCVAPFDPSTGTVGASGGYAIFDIRYVDIEYSDNLGGGTWTTVDDLYDPNNVCYGKCRGIHVLGGAGTVSSAAFRVSGGSHYTMENAVA